MCHLVSVKLIGQVRRKNGTSKHLTHLGGPLSQRGPIGPSPKNEILAGRIFNSAFQYLCTISMLNIVDSNKIFH